MILQKRFRLGMLMLATVIMSFSACSDDDNDTAPAAGGGTGGNNSAETMSLKIDGISKTFDSVFGITIFGSISLNGSDNNANGYPQLTILLNDTLPVGTYNYPGSLIPSVTFINDSTSTYITSTGNVTILTNDAASDRVTGTFDITMIDVFDPTNTINLTEGQFNISY